jgi:hypothetical protein
MQEFSLAVPHVLGLQNYLDSTVVIYFVQMNTRMANTYLSKSAITSKFQSFLKVQTQILLVSGSTNGIFNKYPNNQ